MPTRQATAAITAAAHALGADADPSAWNVDLRRNGHRPRTLVEAVQQILELARRIEVTMLPRDGAMLDALVEAGSLPLVVVAEVAPAGDGGDPVHVVVLQGRDRGEVTGVRVNAVGDVEPVAVATTNVAAALFGRARVEAKHLRLLVPVSVAPTVGGPDRSADDGVVAHGAAGRHGSDIPYEAAHGGGLAGGESGHGHDHHGPRPLARLWALLLRERRDVWLVFGYAALAGLFSLVLPLSVQQIVQLVSGRMILQPTYLLVAFVVLGTLAVGVLQVMQLAVVENLQQRVFARLAFEFSFRVPRLRYDVALREDLPEVMNRFFETITIQKSLAKILLDLSAAVLTTLFGLILLTLYHPYFSFFSLALVLGLVLILRATGPKGLETSINESKYKYKVVHWLEEMARANTAFKYAGRSSLPIERMDELVAGYLKYRKSHFKVLVQQAISVVGFKTLIVGALLVLGIVLVQSNQITLGQFVASEIVVVTVLAGIEKLISSLATVYDMLTAVDKLGHVTDLPLETPGGLSLPAAPVLGATLAAHGAGNGAGAHGAGNGAATHGAATHGLALEARGLTFRYAPGAPPALRGLSVRIAPGERVGITGYAGSGQTTLLKLFGGLLDGYEGAVAVNGVPMRELDRTEFRDAVGQLLSPTDLFDGTIEENVSVGRPDVSTHDVLRAIERVGLSEWLQAQPRGLRTVVRNGGRDLPTHVVSRLLVAQAVAGRPRLVVVDDYYQNVELEARQHLVDCMTDVDQPWTLLLVSHDPTYLAACDRVLVLDGGVVVRDGPFDDLVGDTPLLQRLLRRGAASPPAPLSA
jgi:ABC-type bacteriocin/lantibiotic exporter with double-glycine peptidase domain